MEKNQALLWPNMVRPERPLHISPGQSPYRYTQVLSSGLWFREGQLLYSLRIFRIRVSKFGSHYMSVILRERLAAA
jgi:hypothetical protein